MSKVRVDKIADLNDDKVMNVVDLLAQADIVDNYLSADPTKVLSAARGKALYDLLLANNVTAVQYTYIATAGQTVISGPDLNGVPLIYVPGTALIVTISGYSFVEGSRLHGNQRIGCTFTTPLVMGDEVGILVIGSFKIADMYTKVEADAKITQAAEHVLAVKWESSRGLIQDGSLPLDGQLVSRALYPDAWNLVNTGKAPVVSEAVWQSDPTKRGSYTTGTDSTNFRLPDLNGKSSGSLGALTVRGDGALSAGTDGVIQPDAFQGHYHNYVWSNTVQLTGGAGVVFDNLGGAVNAVQTNRVGTAISDGTNGTPRIANETRMLNATGCWVVKMFGSAINSGTANAAYLVALYETLSTNYQNDFGYTVIYPNGGTCSFSS